MYRVRKSLLPSLLLKHLAVNSNILSENDRIAGYKALSLLITSEDYSMHEEEYFADDDDETNFATISEDVKQLSKNSYDVKKAIRPLSDTVRRAKMRLKK